MDANIVIATPPIIDVVKAGYWLATTDPILPPININALLYTHLFVGYASIDSITYKVTIEPSHLMLINNFSSIVRISNSDVETLLSLQGAKDTFFQIASYPIKHDVFINSSIEVVRAGSFDGLDLQWLYPSSTDLEMERFEILISFWRLAIVTEAKSFHISELLFVASVYITPYFKNKIHYPTQAIKQNLDWVNVISYDFYTPRSSKHATGPSSAFNNPKTKALSGNFGIKSWIKALGNLPRKQIVYGIPFHGWAWKLSNSHEHDVFSEAEGPAQGDYILDSGEIYYSNVKKFIDNNQAEVENNDQRFLIAYTYSDTTWIAYETKYTIADKLAISKSENVLGYFAFNIAADDDVNTLANAALDNW